MRPYSIEAKDVRPGDLMNYVEHPRSYDKVSTVITEGDETWIHFYAVAYAFYTVKHPREGVRVWR